MPKSTFWPLYFITTVLAAAVVWRYAPLSEEYLPKSILATCTDIGARLLGQKPFFGKEDEGVPLPTLIDSAERRAQAAKIAQEATNRVMTEAAVATNTLPAKSRDLAEALKDSVPASAHVLKPEEETIPDQTARPLAGNAQAGNAQSEAFVKKEKPHKAAPVPTNEFADVATGGNADVDPNALPAFRGVAQADPKTATWGVIAKTTELEGFHHEDRGRVAGGRFFLIERRLRREEGLTLIGNFTPKRLPQAVLVPAENLYCFSGSPDDLSDAQRTALRRYYELRAEALDLKYAIEHPKYDDKGYILNRNAKAINNKDYRDKLNEMKRVAPTIRGLAF